MRTFLVVPGLASAALILAPACLAQSVTRAERPQIRVGDSAVFRDTDVRTGEVRDTVFAVVSVKADRIVSETSGATSGARTFTDEWNPVEYKTGETVTFTATPFEPYLVFPLEVGRSWELPFEVDAQNRGGVGRHAKWRWQARVTDVETVSVPAGTYPAFRITYVGQFHTAQGAKSWDGKESGTLWYAPAVGRIVKRESEQSAPANGYLDHQIIEMVSFTAATPTTGQ